VGAALSTLQVRALCCPPPGTGRTCGVPASYLSSQQGAAEAVAVKKELRKASPTCKVGRGGVGEGAPLWLSALAARCGKEAGVHPRSGCLPRLKVLPTSAIGSFPLDARTRAAARSAARPAQLLYVTPEQLVQSAALRDILTGLQQRGRLARFVIDEVGLY
jgi:superfamily II DNA helicase RecQ